MATQSEQVLEENLMQQLVGWSYGRVTLKDEAALRAT